MKDFVATFIDYGMYAITEREYHWPRRKRPYPVYGYIQVKREGKGVGVVHIDVDHDSISDDKLNELDKMAVANFNFKP